MRICVHCVHVERDSFVYRPAGVGHLARDGIAEVCMGGSVTGTGSYKRDSGYVSVDTGRQPGTAP